MNEQPNGGMTDNAGEQRLTKRQLRELRKQERIHESIRGGQRRSLAWLWWVIAVLVVGGLVWWLVARGSGGTNTGGLDAMKQDTHNAFVGNPNASVVVREFSDFQCPACKAAGPVVTQMIQTYGNQIKFEYNEYPLVSIHQNSLFAAEAGECANDQQKFWPMHDMLFDKQSEWESLDKNGANNKFKQYASDLGLNTATFNTCVDSGAKRSVVQEDINQGNAAGVSATPTFFVNDEQITGVPSFDALKAKIDAALANAPAANANTNTASTNTNP